MGYRIYGIGYRSQGGELCVVSEGLRVRVGVHKFEYRDLGAVIRIWGSGFMVKGLGFRV